MDNTSLLIVGVLLTVVLSFSFSGKVESFTPFVPSPTPSNGELVLPSSGGIILNSNNYSQAIRLTGTSNPNTNDISGNNTTNNEIQFFIGGNIKSSYDVSGLYMVDGTSIFLGTVSNYLQMTHTNGASKITYNDTLTFFNGSTQVLLMDVNGNLTTKAISSTFISCISISTSTGDIQSQINTLNTTVTSLQNQINTLTTNLATTNTNLANNYTTNSSLSTTLGSYVTGTSLTTTLGSYVTNSSLSTTLGSYVTGTSLTTTLGVANPSLSNSYVTNSSLTTTLNSYLKLSGGTMSGNITFPLNTNITFVSNGSVYNYIYSSDSTGGHGGSVLEIRNSNRGGYVQIVGNSAWGTG